MAYVNLACKAHGVLVACPGTIQGHSGWYHQGVLEDKYFFTVDSENNWTLVCGPVEREVWKKIVDELAAGIPLVPLPGTTAGEKGYYLNSKNHVVRVEEGG
jgi:hypothetical protein